MDKREYQEKLQEINRLIGAEDYEGAARVADSIDWKRVRNVQTLVMISEVYEVLERYEDSKTLLLRAYRRSPVGRTVLYRLVECCIRLRQFDQAIEYYSEYVQAAPHDNNKYILKYKIYRGRGSSLDEQIEILKAYLDQEYNEKWAYELARLQVQAGRVQEGLATCDDLVLWFHSGKYVIKALELKKKYAPLTPKQQEIYDNRFNEEDDEPEIRPESYLSEAASLAKAERAAAAQEEIKSELAADISQTARVEATRVELSRKAEEAQASLDRKAEESRKALDERLKDEAAKRAAVAAASAGTAAAASAAAGSQAGEDRADDVAEDAAKREAAAEDVRAKAAVEDAQAEAAAEDVQAAPGAEAAAEEVQAEAAVETAAEDAQAASDAEAAAEDVQAKAAVEDVQAEAAAEEVQAEEAAGDIQSASGADAAVEDVRAEAAAETAAEADTESEKTESGEIKLKETEEEGVRVSPEQLQADMVRSMREIVSGVGPKAEPGEDEAVLDEAIEQSKEDQENAVAARGTDLTFRVPVSEASQKRQAGRLTIDDILLSMGERGDHVRRVTGSGVMSAAEESQMTAGQQAEGNAASYNAGIYGHDNDEPEVPRFLRDDVREARQTEEIPAAQIAQADDAMRAQMGLKSRDEAAGAADGTSDGLSSGGVTASDADPVLNKDYGMTGADGEKAAGQAAVSEVSADGYADEDKDESSEALAAAAVFVNSAKVPFTKEVAEAKTRRLPVEEIRRLHEAYLSENASAAAEEAAKNASQAAEKAVEMAEAEAAAAGPAVYEDEDIRIAPERGAGGPDINAEDADKKAAAGAAAGAVAAGAVAAGAEAAAADMAQGSGRMPENSMAKDPGFDGPGAKMTGQSREALRPGEQVTREIPKSAPEPEVPEGRPYLKENQKELFRGFTNIGTLSSQIASAIWQAENRRDDRTSRSGNILILGAHGCGKTTIATGIAKAIAEDKGTHSVKMARIYAADLNRKDIAATIAKIAGGVLIVEEAGDLDDAIVDQLTTAMEFRTDGLIMILEDEQRYIHELLMRHPRFTMKFTAQIYIPEYTGEDLANFAQIYAESKDFVLSEKAFDACRDKIEAARKSGEAVSVTNVIELVDRAMKSANTFFRRIGSARKRYDDQDRIILREKDFR